MPYLSAARILLFAVFAVGVLLVLLPGWCYKINQRSIVLQQRIFSQAMIRNYLQTTLSDLEGNKRMYLYVYRGLGVVFLLLILINLHIS